MKTCNANPLKIVDIQIIREIYSQAAEREALTEKLYQYLKKQDLSNQPVLLAYLGAALALKAKNAFFPLVKLDFIQQAQTIFNQAIKLAPEDIEIRFLRLTIEINTPNFLGLNTNLKLDKALIINHIRTSELDTTMKQAIADYLLKSGLCDETESLILKSIFI
ncbi:MAG: hypothetical protein MUE85_03965 [Microscillaceae bacterium]|nr:hypothetical protein [Microscillaceae bacterium]